MPELLPDGLPEQTSRAGADFSQWADGQAWQFTRGEDYHSTTDSFRYRIRRWAKANELKAEVRPVPATDEEGRPLPANKVEPVGLAVRFAPASADS